MMISISKTQNHGNTCLSYKHQHLQGKTPSSFSSPNTSNPNLQPQKDETLILESKMLQETKKPQCPRERDQMYKEEFKKESSIFSSYAPLGFPREPQHITKRAPQRRDKNEFVMCCDVWKYSLLSLLNCSAIQVWTLHPGDLRLLP